MALTWRECFSTPPPPPPENLDALRLIVRHYGGTYSHSKTISTCTEHSRVMLKFDCENSWGGIVLGGISQVSPPPPPPHEPLRTEVLVELVAQNLRSEAETDATIASSSNYYVIVTLSIIETDCEHNRGKVGELGTSIHVSGTKEP